MEVVLLGAMMVKYDTIVSVFWNLDPFLNIERNLGCFCYNMIIIFKSLYVLYAMQNAIPKLWMLIFTFLCKYYLIYMRNDLVLSACLVVAFHCFDICVVQMTLMGMLAITCESYEFLLDINVLFCTLYYAGQTYKREIHKLVIIISLSLSIGSYVNNIESAETFKFGAYYLLVVLCLSTVFPLLPNRKKYGHRIKFYMTILIVWIVYKGGLHCTNERLSALQYGSNNVCNITQNTHESKNDVCNVSQTVYESQKCGLNETLENLSLDDILNYGNLRKIDVKVKNLTGVMNDKIKSSANRKEASCKYDLIPDKICSMKVDSTEENSETETKGRTDGTTNSEIERIEATEYDRQSSTDMKVDYTEQEITETDIKERADEITNAEVERIEEAQYDQESMTDMKVDNREQENSETEIKERTDGTVKQEIGRIEATECDKPSMADDRKVDSTKQNSVTDIKKSDGTTHIEIGHIESVENHKVSVPDMKVDSAEQENLETEIKERTDGTTSSEMEHIEAAEHDKPSNKKVASTKQESSETEITEKTDGPTNKERELIEATEKDKALTKLINKLIITFGDEKNDLEEGNTNLGQEIFTEDIQDWTDNPFEEDINSVNLFQIETHGYAEYMDDQSDATENFPVTEISVEDLDYTIEKRLGNVERIDNGIILHHEIEYKTLKFKTSPKSEQQSHKKDEFVAVIQNLDDGESEGTLTRTKAEFKETKVQATETYVLSENDAITQAVPAKAFFMDEATEAKAPETRVLEHAESGLFGESRFHSTHVSENEENNLPSENENTTANECKLTAVVKPQNSLLKDSETRILKAQETKLVSNNIMEEIDAKRAEATLSKAFSNPNQVDEIQNKRPVSKERNENKVDSSVAAQADFGSIEFLKTKSKETYKSQIQEHFRETKVTKAREMTEIECSEPIVSTTKDCEKKSVLARYSRASDYEICKPIPSANNHEPSKDSSSTSKFEPFRTEKTKTINLKTENTDKTTEKGTQKYAKGNSDSTDEVVSSNALDSYFSGEVGDNELRKSMVNEILANETTENESMGFVDSGTTALQTTISYQTSEKEKSDQGEDDLPSYSSEASAIKFKPVPRYESKNIKAGKFKDTETKEHGSGPTKISDINAEETKFTSASSPRKNKLESAKKDEAESINTDTFKSQANEIDSMESNEGKVSTYEPVLPGSHESEASGIRANASRETEISYSGTTKTKTRNIYSYTIEPKSKRKEHNSDAIESEDDSHVRTNKLEPTETNYLEERKMEIITIASPKESQLKFTKSREIGDAFKGATDLKIRKSNLASTVQPKPIQDQQTSDSIPNEHGYTDSHLTAPTSEETKESYSNTRETTTIKVMGPEKSQLLTKSSEIREIKGTCTGRTKLGDAKSDELLAKPSEDNNIESDLQFNEVGDSSENELEVSNANNFEARDIKPIKLAGITENQLKYTKTRHPGDSFTGETRFRATKNVLRATESKQNKKQDVSHRKIEEIESSKASYPSEREIQPIEVMVPEKSSPKSTKTRETKDAYKGDAELGDTKTDASRTFERKSTKQGDVSDYVANEPKKVSRLQKNVLEATTVSYFVATEIKPIKVTGPKESQSKPTSGDVEISKSESTIDSEDSQTKSNKAKELEGNKFERIESSKDNVVDLRKEQPILIETSESDYPNKASDSEEIGNKAKVIDNFNAFEYISITSDYIGSRKVSDVSEIKVTEFKESKDDVGELRKQVIKVNPSSKTESEENTLEVFDTSESEESQAERETEVIDDGKTEIGEIRYQDTENAKKAIEHPLTASEKSEITGNYTKTELLMSESDATPVIGPVPKETEDTKLAKAETVIVDVERSEKILSKGNVPPHQLDSADNVMTKIHGIKALGATEIMPEIPDIYKTAAIFQGDQVGEKTETKSEVQKSRMNYAKAAGPEVFQSAEKDIIDTSRIKNDFA